jgi:hypothetical protein
MSIARRGLDQGGFPYSRAFLLRDQLLDTDGTLLRPGRLMSAEGRTWIPAHIGRDDVRVDVDDRNAHDWWPVQTD